MRGSAVRPDHGLVALVEAVVWLVFVVAGVVWGRGGHGGGSYVRQLCVVETVSTEQTVTLLARLTQLLARYCHSAVKLSTITELHTSKGDTNPQSESNWYFYLCRFWDTAKIDRSWVGFWLLSMTFSFHGSRMGPTGSA